MSLRTLNQRIYKKSHEIYFVFIQMAGKYPILFRQKPVTLTFVFGFDLKNQGPKSRKFHDFFSRIQESSEHVMSLT